jgi:hypothetical protein
MLRQIIINEHCEATANDRGCLSLIMRLWPLGWQVSKFSFQVNYKSQEGNAKYLSNYC